MNRIWVLKIFLKMLVSGISTGEKFAIQYLLTEWENDKIRDRIEELRQEII